MSAEPQRSGHKGFHNQNDPSGQSGNPADKRNRREIIGQRQAIQEHGQENGKQGETDILVQTRNGVADDWNGVADKLQHLER